MCKIFESRICSDIELMFKGKDQKQVDLDARLRIVAFERSHAEAFRDLNLDWIEEYFVVEELARRGRPLSIGTIAEALGLAGEVVSGVVDELERNLFFLARNESGEVSWAYPVTVDRTPHRLTFSTGERLHGA